MVPILHTVSSVRKKSSYQDFKPKVPLKIVFNQNTMYVCAFVIRDYAYPVVKVSLGQLLLPVGLTVYTKNYCDTYWINLHKRIYIFEFLNYYM